MFVYKVLRLFLGLLMCLSLTKPSEVNATSLKVQKLIDRARRAKEKNTERLNYGKISKILGVSFSKEFIEISSQVGFDYLSPISWLNSDQTEDNSMIDETLLLKESNNLPIDCVVLANLGGSIILMKCLGAQEEIYWISTQDVENFCKGAPLRCGYDFFPTFSDFFKYLLDEAEKSRAEDAAANKKD